MIDILNTKKFTVIVLVITIITSLFAGTSVSFNAAGTNSVQTAGVAEKAEIEPVGDDPQPTSEPASVEPGTEPATVEPATGEPSTEEPATEEPTTEPTAPLPTKLSLDLKTLSLGINETYQLKVTTDAQSVRFSVTNSSVATVYANGLIKPKETGSTVIVCTAANDLRAECKLTVCKEAKSLKLTKTVGTLGVGEGCYIKAVLPEGTAAFKKTFTSSKTTVATVDSTGLVVAKTSGTVTITCKLKNGVSSKISVNVLPAAKKVTLNTNIATLGMGETFDLNSTIPSGTATAYRNYYSDNTKIAKVTKSGGLITAISTGKTTVRCVTGTGAKAIVNVTVTKVPTKITLKSTASQSIGKQYSLTVSTDKGTDNGRFFKWKSSNSSVVTISKYKNNVATLYPKSYGTATITVKTAGGKTATYKVSVGSTVLKCVDISTWQGGNVDFNKVKASGINYVILRAGFGSTEDNQFENNYKKARAAGMKIGVYWFSYSMSVSGGITEANTCLKFLKSKKLDLPVYYDLEYDPALKKLGAANYRKMAYNFCNTIKKAGFKPGVYASASDYTSFFSPTDFYNRGYSVWNAHWAKSTPVTCDIWQYTDAGRVPGISSYVDMSYIFNLNHFR